MLVARAAVLLGAAYALTGCGASQHEQVQAKVEQFAHATARHDYAALCDDVLAPALVARLGAAGITCRQAMAVFAQSVHNPNLSIARITVRGRTASAVVLAGATGQSAALETIELINTSHGWRLASLAAPTSKP